MENLKIYIDRLRGGQILKIDATLSPDFLDIDEEDLSFENPIHIKGDTYLANEHLIIHLNIETSAYLPCNICNEAVHMPIVVKNMTLTKVLSEIKGAIYDISGEVRESILLQTPLFAECSEGNCPERENLKRFLNHSQKNKQDDIIHFPFAGLDAQKKE